MISTNIKQNVCVFVCVFFVSVAVRTAVLMRAKLGGKVGTGRKIGFSEYSDPKCNPSCQIFAKKHQIFWSEFTLSGNCIVADWSRQ